MILPSLRIWIISTCHTLPNKSFLWDTRAAQLIVMSIRDQWITINMRRTISKESNWQTTFLTPSPRTMLSPLTMANNSIFKVFECQYLPNKPFNHIPLESLKTSSKTSFLCYGTHCRPHLEQEAPSLPNESGEQCSELLLLRRLRSFNYTM